MPDNIYTDQGGSSGFGELAGFGASELGKMWSNAKMVAPFQRKAIMAQYKTPWWKPSLYNRGRSALRAAQQAEVANIWSDFSGARGGPIKRFRMARAGVEKRMLVGQAPRGPSKLLQAGGAGKRKYLRALTRGSMGRTAAGLINPIARFGSAYFMWGSLIPLAAEGLVGGFNEIARLGMQLDRGTPETAVGYRDMATRERAFTMRQSSMMAIHMSQTGIRAALGDEANFLHG
jgi:hypothetical protein